MAEIFANNLRYLRDQSGKKQREVAKFAEVKLRTYQKWEHGESEPRGRSLMKLCSYFGVQQERFYQENGMQIAIRKEAQISVVEGDEMEENLIRKARYILRSGTTQASALHANIIAFYDSLKPKGNWDPPRKGPEETG